MRSVDWARTPVGPVSAWPQSLRTALSILLDTSFGMAIAWGPEYVFFYNDAYRPILGSTKHPAAMGSRLKDIFPEIWHIIGPMFDGVREGKNFGWDNWLLPLDRHGFLEECWFTFSYSPIRDESGGIGGALVTVSEVTARVLGERRLRVLREIAAQTAEATRAEEACSIAARVLATDLSDLPFAQIYLEPVEATDWPLDDVLRTGTASIVDIEHLGIDHVDEMGTTRVRQAIVLPIVRHGDSRPAGVLVAGIGPRLKLDAQYRDFLDLVSDQIATAVSKARAYEEAEARAEALAAIDRAKTAFFTNISHEFRTPLTLMLGPVEEILERSAETPPHDRELLQVAHRNMLRLQKLVNALLDFSRIEDGRAQASYHRIDLAGLTAELASGFRSAMERAGLRFLVDVEPLAAQYWIDRDMWEKIVLNLLSNALKFTLDGEIEVRLREDARGATLTVRDTGSGIPESELPRLFERFHRIEGTKRRSQEGTGIGLALVQELVKLHGGTIEVSSREGEGTSFHVAIPAGTAHLPPERIDKARDGASTPARVASYVGEAMQWLDAGDELPQIPPAAERGARVVIADDNSDMRGYITRLLERRYEVINCADGRAALEEIRRSRPNLLLADIMMPELDGFELLHAIRADPELRTLPVILLSARAGEEARVEGMGAGADDYLVKPFSARELVARVDAHLMLERVRRQAEESLRRSAQALRDADRLKDEFLATLSHELRTPLTAILGWSQMIRLGTIDPDELRTAIEAITRSAKVQSQLIEDVLDVSRITTGKMRLDSKPASLREVVESAVETVRPAADAKAIDLHLDVASEVGMLMMDPDRMRQVIWNLVSNAIKFTPPRGRVDVTVRQGDEQATVQIRDTGPGIAASFLPHLFERFRQADSSTRRSHAGLGLGLALSKDLTELHGGRIHVQSEPGHGATFTVVLPVLSGRTLAEAAPVRSASALLLGGTRVMVVENDDETRAMFGAMLRYGGAEVETASSADHALQVMEHFSPNLVITDIAMPLRDGYDLLREIRAHPQHARIPVLVVTAQGPEHFRRDDSWPSFTRHLSKPVEMTELINVVAELVRADAS
ncbi:MAG TPA: ATP-binding protein [Thermoanaerobaculia bacterium]|nr:ATP-binding protein [Thermoanaerobaculia bacterium]